MQGDVGAGGDRGGAFEVLVAGGDEVLGEERAGHEGFPSVEVVTVSSVHHIDAVHIGRMVRPAGFDPLPPTAHGRWGLTRSAGGPYAAVDRPAPPSGVLRRRTVRTDQQAASRVRFAAARRPCAAFSCLAVRARFAFSAFAPDPADRVRA